MQSCYALGILTDNLTKVLAKECAQRYREMDSTSLARAVDAFGATSSVYFDEDVHVLRRHWETCMESYGKGREAAGGAGLCETGFFILHPQFETELGDSACWGFDES